MTGHHLPRQITPFVGRQQELEEILSLLDNPACHLLTLLGPGGSGKTRLAIEVSHQLDFDDGVYFVPLQPLMDVRSIPDAVAAALKLQFSTNTNVRQQLLTYFEERHLLLVLDNCEHLLDGIDFVGEIVEAAPQVKVLATSREPLKLQQEWLISVGGMTYPQRDIHDAPDHYDAVQLFCERARQVQPGFDFEQQRDAVQRICQLVEGLPLALELAASWMRTLTCAEIATEIEQGLDFLSSDLRDMPERHRSIQAVFDYSWQGLRADEQQVLAGLSVFQGGFTREAAEAVAGADLRTLSGLVEKSLLRKDRTTARYDLHELVKQYAEGQLNASAHPETAQAAHSDYYAHFVDLRAEDLKGHRQSEAIFEMNTEFENVKRAWSWAASHRHESLIEQMIEGLWTFIELRGRDEILFQQAEQVFRLKSDDEPAQLWGRLLARADDVRIHQEPVERALQIAQRYDNQSEIAFCLARLGSAAHTRRDYPAAKALLEQSLMIYRQLENHYAVANVLGDLMKFSYQGTWDDFQRYGEEALSLRREIGDRVGMAWSLAAVAAEAGRQGRFSEAERLWLERISIGYEIDNLNLVALGYGHISHKVYFFQGDFVKARFAAKEAFRIAKSISNPDAAGWALATLGLLASMEEDYHEGINLCQQVLRVKRLGWTTDLASWGLSIAACGLGDYEQAASSLSEAFNFLVNIQGVIGVLASLPIFAIILVHRDRPVRAVELLALAFTHPVHGAGWMEKWPLLTRLQADLEAALGTETYVRAYERGSQLDLMMTFGACRAQMIDQPHQPMLLDSLTERELEILRLVAEGLTDKAVAESLTLAVGTVKWYMHEIRSKLGVNNRVAAINRARELGLL